MAVSDSKSLIIEQILTRLDDESSSDTKLSSLALASELNQPHQAIVGAVKSLQSQEGSRVTVVNVEPCQETKIQLTAEGKRVLAEGSPEVRFHARAKVLALAKAGQAETLLEHLLDNDDEDARIGLNKAVQFGWIAVKKDSGGGRSVVEVLVEQVHDSTQLALEKLSAGGGAGGTDPTALAELKRRKLITEACSTYYLISRGPDFKIMATNKADDTAKRYNFDALGRPPSSGHLHPLQKVRAEFTTILTQMGFVEMETSRYVESSFWNFDSLFIPQKHPARDVQDTFFLAQPAKCRALPERWLVDAVGRVHSMGDYGSRGYGTPWVEGEAEKNVLRTHTTPVSMRVLAEMAAQAKVAATGHFVPAKRFSIDRVYRNETLDATHLAEFHQVEGFVADRGLSLGHLIGVMREFFAQIGIHRLRFKPAYNPYTEPSMEVFAYHPGLSKWVEVGNSGMFRPEVLLPLGLPRDVRVIAWGLSLERPTMIRYGIDNIRSLVGPRVDLRMVYANSICRLDKE